MATRIVYTGKPLTNVRIALPSSKSISNRALAIRLIGGLNSRIDNLSDADDTMDMLRLIAETNDTLDLGNGGTTSRFILAALCLQGRDVILDASDGLRSRPISGLVDALNALGADVTYVEETGRFPIRTGSGKMYGGSLVIPADTSSQFISALMMIGPYLEGGLVLEFSGQVLSYPYIQMTADVMFHYGARVEVSPYGVAVAEGVYQPKDFYVEADWSSASYWFQAAAMQPGSSFFLDGLREDSLQGDKVIIDMISKLGVSSKFDANGLHITGTGEQQSDYFLEDFTSCPDLAPAIAVACGALNITADLTGLKNLRLKECDRALALQRGLYDLNVKTDFCGGSKFKVYPGRGPAPTTRLIKTFDDHRIIMAFCLMSLKTEYVQLDYVNGIDKSYPSFLGDLLENGFEMQFF
ncbi:MAG: 3-phosphoshikimate 1-carboxyvinyltransferase [Bacteroidota bacterium]